MKRNKLNKKSTLNNWQLLNSAQFVGYELRILHIKEGLSTGAGAEVGNILLPLKGENELFVFLLTKTNTTHNLVDWFLGQPLNNLQRVHF